MWLCGTPVRNVHSTHSIFMEGDLMENGKLGYFVRNRKKADGWFPFVHIVHAVHNEDTSVKDK